MHWHALQYATDNVEAFEITSNRNNAGDFCKAATLQMAIPNLDGLPCNHD